MGKRSRGSSSTRRVFWRRCFWQTGRLHRQRGRPTGGAHFVENTLSQVHRAEGCLPIDQGSAARCYAADKAQQFFGQGITVGYGRTVDFDVRAEHFLLQFFDVGTRLPCALQGRSAVKQRLRRPVDCYLAGCKIDADGRFGGPDLHQAAGLGINAVGRQIGDAAVIKSHARLHRVFVCAQERNAEGIHAADLCIRQIENQIEVVNHHVMHHADIGRTKGVGAQSFAADVFRPAAVLPRHLCGRVEAFDVAYLQQRCMPLADSDDGLRIAEVGSQRFFHEDGNLVVEEFAGHRTMQRCRDDDARGVHLANQLAEVGGPVGSVGLGDGLCGGGVDISDGDQFHAIQPGQDAGVVFTQRPAPMTAILSLLMRLSGAAVHSARASLRRAGDERLRSTPHLPCCCCSIELSRIVSSIG